MIKMKCGGLDIQLMDTDMQVPGKIKKGLVTDARKGWNVALEMKIFFSDDLKLCSTASWF